MIKLAWYIFLDWTYSAWWQLRSLLAFDKAEDYKKDSISKPEILILPGVYESWRFMKVLNDQLSQAGYSVHVINGLKLNSGKIELAAHQVNVYLLSNVLKDVIIVAHSKGGLIGKWLMGMEGGISVKHMVAINTPFSGSIYATFMPLPHLREFAPKSRTTLQLQKNLQLNSKITSIYSRYDPNIPGGSVLQGGTNIEIDMVGHFRILGNANARAAVMDTIEKI
jgi:triacylglycerol lipase